MRLRWRVVVLVIVSGAIVISPAYGSSFALGQIPINSDTMTAGVMVAGVALYIAGIEKNLTKDIDELSKTLESEIDRIRETIVGVDKSLALLSQKCSTDDDQLRKELSSAIDAIARLKGNDRNQDKKILDICNWISTQSSKGFSSRHDWKD